MEGTGQWLLSHDTYAAWKKQSAGALLWVHGKHGSGKSYLAAQVIEELRELCRGRNNATGSLQRDNEAENSLLHPHELGHVDFAVPDLRESHQPLVVHSGEDLPDLTVNDTANDGNQSLSLAAQSSPAIDPKGAQHPERIALAYIYCSSQLVQSVERSRIGNSVNTADGYDTTGLLSSLLKQLYQFLPRDQDISSVSDLCFVAKQDYPIREDITKGIKTVITMFS